jgi:dynein heavy chain 1
MDTLDYWIDSKAQGRDNLPPERIPWIALRTLLAQTVYGGRVDNEFDQRLLETFLEQLFVPQSFDPGFSLIPRAEGVDALIAPEGSTKEAFIRWIEKLPEVESPVWLGLPANAEIMLRVNQTKRILSKLVKMQTMEEEDTGAEDKSATGQGHGTADDSRPLWMRLLEGNLENWSKVLPEKLIPLERTAENIKNPLFRCLEREINIASKLLSKIHADFKDLKEICLGNVKQTNYTREIINHLNKGIIPKAWLRYSLPDSVTFNIWLVDFAQRIKQLADIRQHNRFSCLTLWMGGLFNAEAFVTATRQAAAQANGWSLENLELTAEVLTADASLENTNPASFIVTQMTLEGASWNRQEQKLTVADEMSFPLPPVRFTWRNRSTTGAGAASDKVIVPVYLNETRKELLFAVDFPAPQETPADSWYQRGIGILTWKASV